MEEAAKRMPSEFQLPQALPCCPQVEGNSISADLSPTGAMSGTGHPSWEALLSTLPVKRWTEQV